MKLPPDMFVSPRFKKGRNTSNYLLIGNAQLGLDKEILKPLAVHANEYKSKVIHQGNICTDEEKKMYDRRKEKVRTFEKIFEELENKKKAQIKELGSLRGDPSTTADARAERDRILARFEDLEAKNDVSLQVVVSEISTLLMGVKTRIEKLQEEFGEVWFVANDEQYLELSQFGRFYLGEKLVLSEHIMLESVAANGPKTTSAPITARSYNYLKSLKSSVVVPHPTPALASFHREGLNKAWNMYTTGCLYISTAAKRPSEFFKSVHMPSALFLMVDPVTGHFHDRRLHFDNVSCPIAHRIKPCILEDGRGFTAAGVFEVGGENCAVYSTDDHGPFEHRGVLGACRALVELTQAETLINGGDIVDWTSICPHNAGSPLYAEGLRFSDDEESMRRLALAQTDNPCVKTAVLIDANHEDWITRMVAKLPFLKGLMDQAAVYARALSSKWQYHITKGGEDYTYYFGDLAIRHGHNVPSITYALKIFTKYLGGHIHRREELLRATTAGAGAKLGPAYLGNSITSWQNTITTLTKWSEKTAWDIKSVLHDDEKKTSEFAYRGDIYHVHWHVYPGEAK